jgi:AcrR family transcriptional regulator
MKLEPGRKPKHTPAPRAYRQTARAATSKAREAEILAVFQKLLSENWADDVTLAAVAEGAGVTQQTVIRKFGGKEGLLRALAEKVKSEVLLRRTVAPGALADAIAVLVEDYEIVGNLVMRLLAQEARDPMLTRFLEVGRRAHRKWIAQVFAPALALRPEPERALILDGLVVASDLYVWKLLRRDFGYAPAHVGKVMQSLAAGVLSGAPASRTMGKISSSTGSAS